MQCLLEIAGDMWNKMLEAEKAPYINFANEAKSKKNSQGVPKKKRKTALVWLRAWSFC